MPQPALPSPELFLSPDAGAAHSPSPRVLPCGKAATVSGSDPPKGVRLGGSSAVTPPSILPWGSAHKLQLKLFITKLNSKHPNQG